MAEKNETRVHALRVEKLYDNAPLPVKSKTSTDSGFDVFAHNVQKIYAHGGSNGERCLEGNAMKGKFIDEGVFELQMGERALIGTGLKMTVGPGYEIQVRPRSGNALKRGLTVVNTPGTVDEAFRNEVGIIILNTSRQTQQITLGEAIAQVVPMKIELIEVIEEKLNDNTERGMDGFGSTNRRDYEAGVMKPLALNIRDVDAPFNMMYWPIL